MASYNKFQPFIAAAFNKVHNLGADTLKVFLTDTAPTAGLATLSQITEVSYTNLSSRTITVTSSTQSSGTYKLILVDLVLTASGAVGPFRYVGIYNDTASNDELIGWYDTGVETTMASTDTFTCDFDGSNGLFSAT